MDSKTQKILKEYRKTINCDDLSLQIYLGCMEIENKSISLKTGFERYVQPDLNLALKPLERKKESRRKPKYLLDLISLAKSVVNNRYQRNTGTLPHFKTPKDIENYLDENNRHYLQRLARWSYY